MHNELRDNVLILAKQFRLGFATQGAVELAQLVGRLIEAVTLQKNNAPEKLQQFQMILNAMLNCQQAKDWLGLADYLEYELLVCLSS